MPGLNDVLAEQAAGLRVRVLGPLTVEGAAGRRRGSGLGPAQDRQLLGLLATAAGALVPRDVLIDALWEEALPQRPSRALSSLARRLRRALGPDGDRLRSEAGGYRLVLPNRSRRTGTAHRSR